MLITEALPLLLSPSRVARLSLGSSLAALCRHAEPGAPPCGSYVRRRGSSPPSAELGALPFCGQLALTAKTGAESQRRPFPIFFWHIKRQSGPELFAHPLPDPSVGAASSRMGNRDDEYDFLFKGKEREKNERKKNDCIPLFLHRLSPTKL